MTVHNLITNGGFETGTLDGWASTNAMITAVSPHSGRYSAMFPAGLAPSSLSQTVTVEPGENFNLFVSLAKFGIFQNPTIQLRITFLNQNNTEVGTGLSTEITSGTLPSAIFNNWHEIYQVTGVAPANATQARVEIIKTDSRLYYSPVLIDDVNLLSYPSGMGPTGPTGMFI